MYMCIVACPISPNRHILQRCRIRQAVAACVEGKESRKEYLAGCKLHNSIILHALKYSSCNRYSSKNGAAGSDSAESSVRQHQLDSTTAKGDAAGQGQGRGA